jgi:hypothetical protein
MKFKKRILAANAVFALAFSVIMMVWAKNDWNKLEVEFSNIELAKVECRQQFANNLMTGGLILFMIAAATKDDEEEE